MKGVLITIFIIISLGARAQVTVDEDVSHMIFYKVDTTLSVEFITRVRGTSIEFDHIETSRIFDLRSSSDRDSLTNNTITNEFLERLGVFISNQWPDD